MDCVQATAYRTLTGMAQTHWVAQTFENMKRIRPDLQPKKLKVASPHRAVNCAGDPGKCKSCGGDVQKRKTCEACDGSGYDHRRDCRWESTRQYRMRFEQIVSAEIGVKPGTVRAYATPFGSAFYRKPNEDRRKLFDYVRKFGAVRFKDNGEPVKSTFGRGPTREEFLASAPAGKNRAAWQVGDSQ